MVKLGYFFPREGFPPYSEGSFFVKGLIKCIEYSLIMYMNSIFKKRPPFFLFLLIIIIGLECDFPQILVLELLKQFDIQDEHSLTGIVVNRIFIIGMHIF
jgi:hypothetical protein